MKVYVTGNFIEKGVGHHGEVVDVTDWKGRQLIADHQAISEDDHKRNLDAEKKALAERASFEAERAGIDTPLRTHRKVAQAEPSSATPSSATPSSGEVTNA